jgi:hypothetical protein
MFTFVVRVTLSENELVDELESGYVYGVETFLEDYELVEEVCCSKGKGIVLSKVYKICIYLQRRKHMKQWL